MGHFIPGISSGPIRFPSSSTLKFAVNFLVVYLTRSPSQQIRSKLASISLVIYTSFLSYNMEANDRSHNGIYLNPCSDRTSWRKQIDKNVNLSSNESVLEVNNLKPYALPLAKICQLFSPCQSAYLLSLESKWPFFLSFPSPTSKSPS